MSPQTTAHGAWIFVSHSHRDLERVRRVRNALEELGQNPLLFFLRCLGDDSEIDGLIRREIEARTHFILCDSPNARASRWVQAEAEIIQGLQDREYAVIDLHDPWEVQLQRIQRVSKRATVAISFVDADSSVAEAIARHLRDQDYAVFLDVLSAPGGNWDPRRNRPLQTAVETGWVMILLSPYSVHSEMIIKKEIFAALAMSQRDPAWIPVLTGDREATVQELRSWPTITLERMQIADLTEGDREDAITRLIKGLKSRDRA